MNHPLQSRALVVCLAFVAGFSVLSARLVRLQWMDREDAASSSASNFDRLLVLPGERGVIVDRNEEIIARNFPVSSVVADMNHLRDPKVASWGAAYAEVSQTPEWATADEEQRNSMVARARLVMLQSCTGDEVIQRHFEHIARVLARPLGRKENELLADFERKRRGDLVLCKGLHDDVADPLEELIRENDIQGLYFGKTLKRWYASPQLAVHAIGFVNHESRGQSGIENRLENRLAGRDGWRVLKTDGYGRLLAPNQGELSPPRAGLHVKLTLDLGLQAIVEEELDAALGEFIATQGAVILLDPKTGEILAMASRPHFDLNLRENVSKASFNYAIQATYEPGSTIKIVAVSAALDQGLVSPATLVNCENGFYRDGRVTVKDDYPKGTLSVEDIIMKSNNIGTYKLAKQVGRVDFVDYLRGYGFTRKSGLSLSGEQAGLLADSSNPTNFSRMSYGYAASVTPLQVAMAYGALANGGNLMKPRIVKEVVANNGMVMESFPPEVVRRVVQERTARQMRQALGKVVTEEGTASRAAVSGFKVGGKTGTAIKIGPDGSYLDGHYVVSFAGMMPVEDPAFVCVVVIDDPLTNEVKRYGGTIAAPTFAKIATRAAAYLNLEPTEPIEEEEEVLAQAEED